MSQHEKLDSKAERVSSRNSGRARKPGDPASTRERKHIWRRLGPLFAVAILGLAAFLLYRTLRRYSLDEILTSMMSFPTHRLLLASVFAAASYFCLSFFDWFALRYVERPLPYPKVLLASFTSLSLGHNIGFAALSSGAIRYRFYSRWGLSAEDVAKIILFCGTTVGLGLILLGGVALLLRLDLASEITGLSTGAVLALAFTCLAAPAGYLALAAYMRKPLKIWKWSFQMPPLGLALAQLVIGPLNFACVAACLHQALSAVADLPYLAVAAVYVIATVTALITHVPGGLGVIESVVLFLLLQANLIGALVMFRVVYFLVPLGFGASLFVLTELVYRRRGSVAMKGAPA